MRESDARQRFVRMIFSGFQDDIIHRNRGLKTEMLGDAGVHTLMGTSGNMILIILTTVGIKQMIRLSTAGNTNQLRNHFLKTGDTLIPITSR